MAQYSSYPAYSAEQRRREHQRHYPAKPQPRPQTKTDLDVILERHRFIRQGGSSDKLSWEDELAEKWYSKLFREFAIIDLKHYKSGQIAMRWRTEDEVLAERGERTCGNLRCQDHEPAPERDMVRWRQKQARKERDRSPARGDAVRRSSYHPGRRRDGSLEEEEEEPLVPTELTAYQLKFQYEEFGERLEALVKVILCKRCGKKLTKGRLAAQAALGDGQTKELDER